MSKIHGISGGGGGVIFYRIHSFSSPRTDLNFRHLSSCDTMEDFLYKGCNNVSTVVSTVTESKYKNDFCLIGFGHLG